jgi:hypothetical protein
MMNQNEKRTLLIGKILCVAALLASAPLVWAATRPTVAPPQDGPSVVQAVAASRKVQAVIELPTVEIVGDAAPKARPAQAKARPAPKAPWRCEREDLVQGSGSVVYCHG